MRRSLFLAGVILLLGAGYLWLKGDPWEVASAKGTADAAALSQIQSQPDRISFFLAKDTALLKAVVWSRTGSILYPGQSTYVPTRFDISQNTLNALTQATSQALQSSWSRFDTDGEELLYCQTTPRVCLVYARAELENGLAISLNAWRAGVMWAMAALGGLSLLLLLQRKPMHSDSAQLVLLPEQHSARHGTLQVALTPRDFRLLEYLQRRQGTVVTKDELYDAGWGRDFMPNSRALDQHIINLRKKLDPDKTRSPVIETVRGVGYKLVK